MNRNKTGDLILNVIKLIHNPDKGVNSAAIDDNQDDTFASPVQFLYSYSNGFRYQL